MTRIQIVAAAFVLTFALTLTSADAKTVSFNLDGEGLNPGELLDPGDVAGVVAVGNWNNITGPFVYDGTTFLGTVNDDSGAATGITFASRGGIPNSNEPINGSDANSKMMRGSGPRTQIDAPNSSNGGINHWGQVQMTGLNAEFSGGYDVYIYYGAGYTSGDNTGGFMGGWGEVHATTTGFLASSSSAADPGASTPNPGPASPVGTPFASVEYTTMIGSSAGLSGSNTYDETQGFVESTGAGPGNEGNYVKLSGLNEDTLVLSMVGAFISGGNLEWNSNTILGIQVVGNAPVPEPSTFALAAMGLVGLMSFQGRSFVRARKKQQVQREQARD